MTKGGRIATLVALLAVLGAANLFHLQFSQPAPQSRKLPNLRLPSRSA